METVRNLLFVLAEKQRVAWVVARAIARNFDKLPDNVRNLLFKLAKKAENAINLLHTDESNYVEREPSPGSPSPQGRFAPMNISRDLSLVSYK